MYFPHTGVVSVVVGLTSGQFVEAGMLGRNSGVGSAAPLDGATALNRANAHFQRLIGWSPNGEAEAQRTAD